MVREIWGSHIFRSLGFGLVILLIVAEVALVGART
jgi:hypothetical protein